MTKIAPSILAALRDCASFRHGTYIWKWKTMEKAVVLGLAEKVAHRPLCGCANEHAFVLTDAGHAALAEKDS